MMALMFSLSSPINRSFAYLYVATTSFSVVLSVILLPIILSWVGLRRTRIVFHRKYKSVLGGMMWDGQSERDQDGDNYWSSDDESSFYHDTDKEGHDPFRSGNINSEPESYVGFEQMHRGLEPERIRTRSGGPSDGGGGSPERWPNAHSSSLLPRVPSSSAMPDTIARSLAGGGHEVTLEQLFVMAAEREAVVDQPPPQQRQALTSSGGNVAAPPPIVTNELRRSADVAIVGGSPSGSLKLLSDMTHKRTASGLRDLFFGGSTLNVDPPGGMATTDGLDSFPSPSPTPGSTRYAPTLSPASFLALLSRFCRESWGNKLIRL
jgi:hypothetical protein